MVKLRHRLLLPAALLLVACFASGEAAVPTTAPAVPAPSPEEASPSKISDQAPAAKPVQGPTEAPAATATPAPAAAPATASAAAAPAAQEATTPAACQNSMGNALQVLQGDMWDVISVRHYQWVIAIFAFVFGLAALYDGRDFFKKLVLICVAAVGFCFVLGQLRRTWTEGEARIAKYVASLEVGVFMAWAAKEGWKGTQLLLGFFLGLYMFHAVQGVALTIPYLNNVAMHSAWKVSVCTFMVGLGAWMTHEHKGAGRVFGILSPLLGSSLVVATMGYLFMLSCCLPAVARATHADISPSDVPSVFEFWYMIVLPMHSQAVGFFTFTDKDVVIGHSKFEVDRILGIFFWIVIFVLGAYFQLRAEYKERQTRKDADKARWLTKPRSESLASGTEEPLLGKAEPT